MNNVDILIKASPVPTVLIGADERVIVANTEAERVFGAISVGRHYLTSIRQPVLLDCIETALRLEQRAETTFSSTQNQRESTFRVVCAPLCFTDGQNAILITLEDQTDLQEAGQMRRDFVANVSHELRTPLTALMGFIETLKGAARDDAVARGRFLEIMGREAGRMNRLVADLLSLSRVESVERMRPTETVDLVAILKSVVTSLRPLAEGENADIALLLEPDEAPIRGDADQLTQVFMNLAENAIKYGGGKVTVGLKRIESDPAVRGPSITVVVSDNGEGIDPAHIPRLTERFYRVDNHRSRELGGTGLGLAIVKHIVNRHRGRLKIDSAAGEGTRIQVSLPAS